MKPIYRLDEDEVIYASENRDKSHIEKITENHFQEFLNSKNINFKGYFSPYWKDKNYNPFKLVPSKGRNNSKWV